MDEKVSFKYNLIPEFGTLRNVNGLWSFKVKFKPFQYLGQTVEANIGCCDLDLGTDTVADLDGKTYEWNEDFFRSGADASFYVLEHDFLKYLKITFGELKNGFIKTVIKSTVDFTGVTEEDCDDNMNISFQIDLEIKE